MARKKNVRISTRMISRLEKKAKVVNSFFFSREEIEQLLKDSHLRYYQLKQEAINLRESWLKDLSAIQDKSNGQNQDTIYANLIRQEKQRRAGRRLKIMLGKCNGKGFDKVSVKVNYACSELTRKEEIEVACQEENRNKFLHSRGTPAMTGQLVRDLGFIGESEACKQILDGVYQVPAVIYEHTFDYLAALKHPKSLENAPQASITTA